MADTDVKGLLLQVDASMELLRRELGKGEQKLTDFERFVANKMKRADGHFAGLGRGLAGVREAVGSVQTSIIAMGASIGTYFSGRELIQLLDSFTRLQNNLRVAGVAGEQMKAVQDRLFESAQRYGVEIEGLSKLFSTLTQASKELGVTQGDVFKLTDLVSASLKITGVSAQDASGALLQLGQALRGGKIQAEEYNSLLDGLYPLLEAVARGSDRWKGSVSKLTADVKAGKVASKEFAEAGIKGMERTLDQAGKAATTLSGGFTSLTNALTVYFGEADKANGVSAALGKTLEALSENLDTIVPAVSLLVSILGARFVVAATSSAAAALATSTAVVALQARMAGAATTAEALTLAMNGLKGSIATVAVLALGAAVYAVATASTEAEAATEAFSRGQANAAKQTEKVVEATSRLATAHGQARAEAMALARAEAENIKQKIASAKASLALAKAEAARQIKERPSSQSPGSLQGIVGRATRSLSDRLFPANATPAAGRRADEIRGEIDAYKKALAGLEAQINSLEAPAVAAVGGDKKTGRKGGGGPSAADIEGRFNSELVNLAQQALSAQASMAQSAEERAEYELRGVELARKRTETEIRTNTDYSAVQKERLLAQLDALADLERERVAFDKKRQLEQDAQQIADANHQAQADALQIQFDLTSSNAERRRLAQEIVDLEIRHQRAILDAIIASETATEADKKRAQIMLKGLAVVEDGRRQQVARENETPAQRYMRDLSEEAENLGEAYETSVVNGLDRLNDSLAESAKSALGLHGILGDIIGDLIEIAIRQTLIGPLAGALFGGGIGTIFGRATGGPVQAGRPYVVGEHGKPELFVPSVSGKVISGLRANSGGGQQVVNHFDLRGALVTEKVYADMKRIAASTVMETAPTLLGASTAIMARQMNRRRL